MTDFDPRTTLARADLAAQALEGLVRAKASGRPSPCNAPRPPPPCARPPDADAEQLDQLLFGELFEVLDGEDGWLWGQARRDGYVGWVGRAAFAHRCLRPPIGSRPSAPTSTPSRTTSRRPWRCSR